MSDEPSPLKDAIMDAVYVPLERDDMQTPCTFPFMTSSEHGVCDGDGCPVSDETIASALNAVAKIQAEYHKVKKETQKGMTDEPSPRPLRVDESIGGWKSCVSDANGNPVASCWGGGPTEQQEKAEAIAALIVDAVNERERLRDIVRKTLDAIDALYTVAAPGAIVKELTPDRTCLGVPIGKIVADARAAIGEDKHGHT